MNAEKHDLHDVCSSNWLISELFPLIYALVLGKRVRGSLEFKGGLLIPEWSRGLTKCPFSIQYHRQDHRFGATLKWNRRSASLKTPGKRRHGLPMNLMYPMRCSPSAN